MHAITETLLRWYDEHGRTMPWRGIQDPYGTWVSETMLQQTRVDTVRAYYPRFMARFPTVAALAEAPEEEVLKMWEGLGYYSRARHLHAGAQQVMAEFGGVIPKDPEQLIKIKGIGPYTSCAIASIAYGVRVPAVDGNVIRVISRLYHVRENPLEKPWREFIQESARDLVPRSRAGDHNQAMMDLGAMICVPGTPDCDRCPLRERCEAYAAGDAEELPRLPEAKPPKEVDYDVPVILSRQGVLLRRREEKLLQGLWCFPLLEGHHGEQELQALIAGKLGVKTERVIPRGKAKHVFTHQVWRMNLFLVHAPAAAPAGKECEWIPLDQVEALPFPVAMKAARKEMERALAEEKEMGNG